MCGNGVGGVGGCAGGSVCVCGGGGGEGDEMAVVRSGEVGVVEVGGGVVDCEDMWWVAVSVCECAYVRARARARARVCVCVCARARARARVCFGGRAEIDVTGRGRESGGGCQ